MTTPDFDAPPRFPPESPLHRSPTQFLRGGLGRFATGVAVVTFEAPADEGTTLRRGITVNSFTSVSLDPPLVLVSIQRTVASHELIRARPFTVNVLGAEHEHVALHFAGRPQSPPVWVEDPSPPVPRLAGMLAWFACSPWAEYPGGDHTLYLGHVDAFGYRSGDALGFVNGRFTAIPEPLSGHEWVL